MQNRLSHAEYELLHRSFKEETAELLKTIALRGNPYDGKRVEVDWVDRTKPKGDINFVLEPIEVVLFQACRCTMWCEGAHQRRRGLRSVIDRHLFPYTVTVVRVLLVVLPARYHVSANRRCKVCVV